MRHATPARSAAQPALRSAIRVLVGCRGTLASRHTNGTGNCETGDQGEGAQSLLQCRQQCCPATGAAVRHLLPCLQLPRPWTSTFFCDGGVRKRDHTSVHIRNRDAIGSRTRIDRALQGTSIRWRGAAATKCALLQRACASAVLCFRSLAAKRAHRQCWLRWCCWGRRRPARARAALP